MFPLGAVLLPGEVLPLQVFEPRYRALVQDCFAAPDGPRFGVVLIARGHEVGGGDERTTSVRSPGTAHETIRRGGRPCVRGRGTHPGAGMAARRSVPGADGEPVEDEPIDLAAFDDALPAVLDASVATHALIVRVAAATGREPPPFPALVTPCATATPPTRSHGISYALASSGPLGAADRLRVLAAPTPLRRLRCRRRGARRRQRRGVLRLGPEDGAPERGRGCRTRW